MKQSQNFMYIHSIYIHICILNIINIYILMYIYSIYIYMYIKYNQYICIYLYIYIQYISSDFMWRIFNLFIIRQNVLNRVKVMELFYVIYFIDLLYQYRAWLFYECWKSLILSIDAAYRGRRNKPLTTDLQRLAKIGKPSLCSSVA